MMVGPDDWERKENVCDIEFESFKIVPPDKAETGKRNDLCQIHTPSALKSHEGVYQCAIWRCNEPKYGGCRNETIREHREETITVTVSTYSYKK